jgi:hypothetical protein
MDPSVNGFTAQNGQTTDPTSQQQVRFNSQFLTSFESTYSAPPTFMMGAPGLYTNPVAGFVPPMTMYPPMMTMPYGTNTTTTDWQEFSTPDGRKYYYNRITKVTQWEKPQELINAEKTVSFVVTLIFMF